jgi:hypothetical protein
MKKVLIICMIIAVVLITGIFFSKDTALEVFRKGGVGEYKQNPENPTGAVSLIAQWVETLPKETQECIKTKVGIKTLEDAESGKLTDVSSLSLIRNAGCTLP